MGLGRFIKHVLVPGSYSIDLVKNIVDEGSVVEGYKKSIKQEFTEDNPLTASIYKHGKYDGKKEGYAEASDEYEKNAQGRCPWNRNELYPLCHRRTPLVPFSFSVRLF